MLCFLWMTGAPHSIKPSLALFYWTKPLMKRVTLWARAKLQVSSSVWPKARTTSPFFPQCDSGKPSCNTRLTGRSTLIASACCVTQSGWARETCLRDDQLDSGICLTTYCSLVEAEVRGDAYTCDKDSFLFFFEALSNRRLNVCWLFNSGSKYLL